MPKRKKERKLQKLIKKMRKLVNMDEDSNSDDNGSNEENMEPEEILHASNNEDEPAQEDPDPQLQEQPSQDSALETQQVEHEGLQQELLAALGTLQPTETNMGPPISEEISKRWTPLLSKGLEKEDRFQLLKKYIPFENLPKMIPSKLNPEVSTAVHDVVKKRDQSIEEKQKILTAALSALGTGLQLLLTKGDERETIKCIFDASKLLCDTFHNNTLTRRILLLKVINKDLREPLQQDPDSYLFGENLTDRIKNAKALQRSGQDLKIPPAKPPAPIKPRVQPIVPSSAKKTLNWRAPPRPQYNRKEGAGGRSAVKKNVPKEQPNTRHPSRRR